MRDVTYISAQSVDDTATTNDRAVLKGPITLFRIDLGILFKNTRYIFDTVLPRTTLSRMHGVAEGDSSSRFQNAIPVIVFIIELVAVCASGILFFIPVWLSLFGMALVFGMVWFFQHFTWGESTVRSRFILDQRDIASTRDEKWFFINGIATSHASLQYSCDRLAGTFRREVTGIHNKSYGTIGDILECLIQRCLGYYTKDVRKVFHELRAATLDQSITKVVIIAHSQGGILAALALDRMFLELPNECMAKVEVYTFGSAAAHMNNPLRYAAHTHTRPVPSNSPLRYATQTQTQLVPSNTPVTPIVTTVSSEPEIPNTTLTDTTHTPTPPSTETTNSIQETPPSRIGVMEPEPTSESSWGPSMRQILSSSSPKNASEAALPEERINIELQPVPVSRRPSTHYSYTETLDIERDAADRTENIQTRRVPETASETAPQVTHQTAPQPTPQTTPQPTSQMDGRQCAHVIETIEHYCNERDLVPRWGVLYNRQNRPGQRYAGSVFIQNGQQGHLFNHHYLDTMFRLPELGDLNGMNPFLGERVLPAEQDQPSSPATDDVAATSPSSSQQADGTSEEDSQPSPGPKVDSQVGVATRPGATTGGPPAEALRPTVAQLSKLAKYMEGGKA